MESNSNNIKLSTIKEEKIIIMENEQLIETLPNTCQIQLNGNILNLEKLKFQKQKILPKNKLKNDSNKVEQQYLRDIELNKIKENYCKCKKW
ncbi:hypothetical protein A3Q56_07338 [Intoshia linei]|uniref:Uncharacterized protein n=1 Tax=Intoshia linei TaxID=1819745 RepID=A0A177ATX5_9BILA|nr:hypothetical protein A3Q56_07338 [Intoshia linei]